MERIDRRLALKIIGGAAAGVMAAEALPSQVRAQDADPSLRGAVFAARNTGLAGPRIANRIEMEGKGIYLFSNMAIVEPPDGNFQPWNILDKVAEKGLDDKLANGSTGVYVPKQTIPPIYTQEEYEQEFKNRLVYFGVPTRYRDYLNEIRTTFDPGLPTSEVKYIGPGGRRVLGVLRLQSASIQEWIVQGKFELQLIGNAVAQLDQFIPRDALLDKPTDDSDIQPNLLDRLYQSYNSGGLTGLINQTGHEMGISGDDAHTVTYCESTNNPFANKDGLWQVIPSKRHQQIYIELGADINKDSNNPVINSAVAVEVKSEETLNAWSCARRYGIPRKYGQ